MLRTLKAILWRVACLLGMHVIARRVNRRRLLIVNYHGIRPDNGGVRGWLLLPEGELVAQLRYLQRHYRVLPLDEALVRLWDGTLTEPTACITFDDGYRNNRTLAFPVLRGLRLPATVYLTTGLIGTDRMLWTTEIELAFERTARNAVDLSAIGLGSVDLASASARHAVGLDVKAHLKDMPHPERLAMVSEIVRQLGDERDRVPADFALLSWEEVRSMATDGLITFGAHTVNHVILSRVDDASVRSEVHDSIAATRAIGQGVSATFAYPNGRRRDFDSRAVEAVAAAGGIAAVTTIEGLNDRDTDRFALRRVVVGADMTLPDFKLRTSGFIPLLRQLAGRPADA